MAFSAWLQPEARKVVSWKENSFAIVKAEWRNRERKKFFSVLLLSSYDLTVYTVPKDGYHCWLGSWPHTWDFGRRVGWGRGTWRPRNLWEAREDTELGAGVCGFLTLILQQYCIYLESPAGSISGWWYLNYFLLFCHRVLIYNFFSHHLHNGLCFSCFIFPTNSSDTRPFTNTGAALPSSSATFSS